MGLGHSAVTVVAAWRAGIEEGRMQRARGSGHVRQLQTGNIVINEYWPFETDCDPRELLLTL
ncbi:unnamed protein product, partial [Callosobruchus maculatus]